MLRRCLGQQGDVRLAFYSSLMELMESSPSLVPIIFEIVHAHVSFIIGEEISVFQALLIFAPVPYNISSPSSMITLERDLRR